MGKIVIIGNGIAGVTTARHIRKLNSKEEIMIVSAETKYFFSRTALMYIYMGHMKFEHTKPYEDSFWKKNRIDLCFGKVEKIDFESKKLSLDIGKTITYDSLVLAVGSKPNRFGWKGQDLPGVQGLYSCQDLELMEKNTKGIKSVVIVGGGLIGVEMAEMLLSRNIEVHFLIRENHFWGNVLSKNEAELIASHMINDHGVDLKFNSSLAEITSGSDGRANGVITESGEKIECQFVGLTAGVSANISFLKNTKLETNRGILVDSYLRTNQPDVYALGDCAEFKVAPTGRKAIEQVWYTGRMMGETLAQTICNHRTAYHPGHWFNSAKFFDIEYQTYGWVWAKPKENEARFYWGHKNGKMCIHLNYDKNTHQFIGINNFGMRMRHAFFDKVLTKKKSVSYVLAHLSDANFDPEFYKKYASEIVSKFNQENNTSIELKKKSWKRIFSEA